jgi:hypothetical protein
MSRDELDVAYTIRLCGPTMVQARQVKGLPENDAQNVMEQEN